MGCGTLFHGNTLGTPFILDMHLVPKSGRGGFAYGFSPHSSNATSYRNQPLIMFMCGTMFSLHRFVASLSVMGYTARVSLSHSVLLNLNCP